VVAKDPDEHPVLLPLMAILAVATLVASVLGLAGGEIRIGQVALDMVVQVLLAISATAYYQRIRATSSRNRVTDRPARR